MNYIKQYNKLIENAKTRCIEDDVYYERHHIIPHCMNGEDTDINIVPLTAKEHYIAHKLLYFSFPDNEKLFFAWHMMAFKKTDCQKRHEISAREYALLIENYRKFRTGIPCREDVKNKIRITVLANKYKHTDAAKLKMSIASKGRKHTSEAKLKIGKFHKGKIVSDETRLKSSKSHMGQRKYFSEEHRRKLSTAAKLRGNGRLGIKHSDATKLKMSISAKNRIKKKVA